MPSLSDTARELAASALRARPDFLIVGAQKAGTTSLHSYLSRHPNLTPGRDRKELHYFNLYHERRSFGWYLSHFPYKFRRGQDLLFESTPDYLMHASVPGRIRNHLGQVKLIAILREPAERAFSAWRMWHHFADSKPELAFKADPRSFATAISEELESPDGQKDKRFHYVSAGHYADQLTAYRRHFSTDDMLVLNYADMTRDLPGFLEGICRFLGVERFPARDLAGLADERLWVTPKVDMTDEIAGTLERLRAHYAPHDARLFDMLDGRWAW